MVTNVYIDGFNLYYRALRGTKFKWLDLRKLAEVLFPGDTIHHVCYFTARIHARPEDPSQPQRQQAYLRALETLENFSIYYGDLRPRVKWRPLVSPVPGLPDYVQVRDMEEKGTDVNLATRLLIDGFKGEYEQAAVVSRDADFARAIQCVRDDLELSVALVNPDRYKRTMPNQLSKAATSVTILSQDHLRRSQFPDTFTDAKGVITKPAGW